VHVVSSKYCTRTQCCCIWLTCKTFQRYVSFKICKGLFYWNQYYNCVRRFVVSDPELPNSLYLFKKLNKNWEHLLQYSLLSIHTLLSKRCTEQNLSRFDFRTCNLHQRIQGADVCPPNGCGPMNFLCPERYIM